MLIFFIKCITVFNIAFMPRRYILDIINFQKDGNKMNDNINKTEFDKVFKLMKESFPESEYQTYEKQQKLLNTKEYKILTKYDENKKSASIRLGFFICILFLCINEYRV